MRTTPRAAARPSAAFSSARPTPRRRDGRTPELVELSLQRNGAQLLREHAAGNPAVTSMEDTCRAVPERAAGMARVLRRLYLRWLERCV